MSDASAAWLRFFRSELRIVFGRRRNQALLAVVAVFPVVIGIALRAADRPGQTGGPSVAFINQLAGNGVFLTFIALSTLLVLVLPVVVAVVARPAQRGVLERERAEEQQDGLGRGVAVVRPVREAAVVAGADARSDRGEEREREHGLPPRDAVRRRVPRGSAEADERRGAEEENVRPVG